MADNIFLGFSNARCLDLMCGASSQLRSRNSNTSLDKEGNAIRAVVLFTVVYQQKSTSLDLFRWKHIFPTRIAIWKVYPIFRQTHTHTHTHTHIMNRRCIEAAFDMQWSHLNRATFGTLAGLHSGFFNGGLDCIKANIVGGKIGRIDYSDLFRRFQIWFQHPGFWSIIESCSNSIAEASKEIAASIARAGAASGILMAAAWGENSLKKWQLYQHSGLPQQAMSHKWSAEW